ncbi:hypothetical protein PA598K_00081 [Paenibacillus sp. 598K]|uniref:DUF6323 family protein n=1 Tax=Paenibacillus sp. 598K TaxID=1117987 RepID=UPI000FFAF3C9|nr:DUF6323 family protein [Paenibacillus sp. 598K]GBF71868.1 hypothetical protein PA598K_00081 [Paenibacillus sp. 598K]
MFWPRIFQSLNASVPELYAAELLGLNEQTRPYGVVLTEQEIAMIMVARDQVLQSYGRVELGIDVTKEMVEQFASSAYVEQESYAETLMALHEIFYNLKNETEDRISDYQLIHMMKRLYEEECAGSLDLLQSRLEAYAEQCRVEAMKNDSDLEGDDAAWQLKR